MQNQLHHLYVKTVLEHLFKHAEKKYGTRDTAALSHKLVQASGVSYEGVLRLLGGDVQASWLVFLRVVSSLGVLPSKFLQQVDDHMATLAVVEHVRKMSDEELTGFLQDPNNTTLAVALVRTLLDEQAHNVTVAPTTEAVLVVPEKKPVPKKPAPAAKTPVTTGFDRRVELVSRWGTASTEEKAEASEWLMSYQRTAKLVPAPEPNTPGTACTECGVVWPDVDMVNPKNGTVHSTCPSCRRAAYAWELSQAA